VYGLNFSSIDEAEGFAQAMFAAIDVLSSKISMLLITFYSTMVGVVMVVCVISFTSPGSIMFSFLLVCWWHSSVVERQSLTGELPLVCA